MTTEYGEWPSHAGRTAIVTGAARGLGAALAHGLAARGALVATIDLRDAAETRDAILAAGGQCFTFTADVADEGEVSRVAAEIEEQCGPCDILVNNAGTHAAGLSYELSYEAWQRMFRINVDSQFLMTRAVAPQMMKRGWGRIVNLSSGSIYATGAGSAAYMASKAAVLGLTAGVANDLGEHGVTVNAVSPGFTKTPLADELISAGEMPPNVYEMMAQSQAIKRPATPEDLVGTVLFLTSQDSAFVTGKFLCADAGQTRQF